VGHYLNGNGSTAYCIKFNVPSVFLDVLVDLSSQHGSWILLRITRIWRRVSRHMGTRSEGLCVSVKYSTGKEKVRRKSWHSLLKACVYICTYVQYLLRRERKNWEDKIREATKEVEGLENVLKVQTAANMALRRSLLPADDRRKLQICIFEKP
jgi:hypothetical protein